jgi:hypothetical protein
MTLPHLLYIPTIFLLGFVFGLIYSNQGEEKDRTKAYQPSGKILFLTFLIFILVFLITHIFEVPSSSRQVRRLLNDQEIFDRNPVFSSSEFYSKVKTFSDEGISTYKRFTYTIDILFPISFFLFLITFARYVSQRPPISKNGKYVLIVFPILWLLYDLIENLMIYILLSEYPKQLIFLAGSVGNVTIMKFGLLICSVLAPILVYGYSEVKRLSS